MLRGQFGLIATLYSRLLKYLLKFGVVGAVGFVVDVVVFNALLVGGIGSDHWLSGPIWAKVVSVAAATLVTWFGNRYWTFREHRRANYLRELFEFSVVAVSGLLINLVCLYISHYVLGYTSLIADNISGTLIGTLLATIFRFVLYRYWVFNQHRVADDETRPALDSEQKAELGAAALFEDDQAAAADASPDAPGPNPTL
ncbi:GtrA family protein [Subtercola lobariae]|uniref:GtrA/DPMS transmembrane domain-containing protein n=1 Tax=Subtercola lobariae TaxID=1588641 RepID=A0A917EW83_9MICO|nr:GtrA family protein [Subtercola lobariae]GGF14203.1 hypothetical protein GCM10011399_05080 [Subtercola lobariae]